MRTSVLIAILAALTVTGGLYKLHNSMNVDVVEDIPTPVYDAWVHWKQRNGKSYGTDTEDKYRSTVFFGNMKFIQADYSPSNTYTLGLNQFADLTQEEFKTIYLNTKVPEKERNEVTLPEDDLAATVDWRSKGAVTPIKNQGQCGSCWAFSTTGSLEGANYLKNKTLLSFSEQQLVSCSSSFGNMGCNGGLMDYGFKYVMKNGITLEKNFPYTATNGTCRSGLKSAFKISSYSDVPASNEKQFQAAVAKQPVSIAVDAGPLQLYVSGIFTKTCGTQLDHGVLCVGYQQGSYYIVKNSWGASWGEQGYVRMGRVASKSGQCGMFLSASYPIA